MDMDVKTMLLVGVLAAAVLYLAAKLLTMGSRRRWRERRYLAVLADNQEWMTSLDWQDATRGSVNYLKYRWYGLTGLYPTTRQLRKSGQVSYIMQPPKGSPEAKPVMHYKITQAGLDRLTGDE